MSNKLSQLKAQLTQVEQVFAAAGALPAIQRETILTALCAQRNALSTFQDSEDAMQSRVIIPKNEIIGCGHKRIDYSASAPTAALESRE